MSTSLGIDGVVVVFFFLITLGIGLFSSRIGQKKKYDELTLGGRRMPWWAILGSIIAAETSAGAFLGTPAEGYVLKDFTYLQLALGTVIARIIIGFLFIKPFFQSGVHSIYQFLETRFGPFTQKMASATFLLSRMLATGTRLYVAAIILVVGAEFFLHKPLSRPQEISLYFISIFLISLFTASYTALGGIKAVIWTDLIQALIMLFGAAFALFFIFAKLSSVYSYPEIVHLFFHRPWFTTGITPSKGLLGNLLDILAIDYTLWSALIGSTFTTMATHGTDQDIVQRLLTAKNYQKSRLSLILSGLADIPIGFLFLSIGLLLSFYYSVYTDPALPTKPNEVFPYFIISQLPSGIRGMVVAAIFATATGSLSAALNALATSFCQDWLTPSFERLVDEKKKVSKLRGATLIFALLTSTIGVATALYTVYFPSTRILPIILGIIGFSYGPLLGVFLLGLLTRHRGTDRGNVLAMIVGFCVVLLLSKIPNSTSNFHEKNNSLFSLEWLPHVAYPWRIFIGSVATFSIGILFRNKTAFSQKAKPS
ncbi:sodium:solute symporter [Methylacidiphilum caldifontis]|uniref:Sodium:proline symporter n=1 Tax=Methylacidiphilum caldifontis TaxID=2795386 RepID=A0A4Y8PHV8_9BACT|nr:sodium:solute symporter [Methylacidiphilum caldifontis]TFE73402.1 sodium:proline symporter [Methylacidiphilum caldifontis]